MVERRSRPKTKCEIDKQGRQLSGLNKANLGSQLQLYLQKCQETTGYVARAHLIHGHNKTAVQSERVSLQQASINCKLSRPSLPMRKATHQCLSSHTYSAKKVYRKLLASLIDRAISQVAD